MATKVFRELNNFKLIGDERDIMVRSKYKLDVMNWCNDNNIEAIIPLRAGHLKLVEMTFGVTLWRVKDEQQRLMFALRWS